MKILRTAAIALIGISLSTPSAHACELDFSFFTWVYQMMHPQQPDVRHDYSHESHGGGGRDCSHGGGGTVTGGGGGTVTGGGGGTTTGGGGSTTTPPLPKS